MTLRGIAIALAIGALTLSACTATPGVSSDDGATASTGVSTASGVWSDATVHTFALTVDEQDLDSVLETYASTGEKEWISATVTIDGQTFDNVGLKLKGNSSLRGVSTDSDPDALPWIIRLDKYVDDQSLDGSTEFVVRGNNSQTSLNEALALAMLAEAGLASEEYAYAQVSFNGSAGDLRLIVENPDDSFMERELGDGYLYKSDSDGDWSYRGTDAEEYADSFDQKGGDDNLDPLIAFLDFVNNSDDATFASDLPKYLDVDAFATYLAFGGMGGQGGGMGGGPGGGMPDGQGRQGGQGGGMPGGNILSERFLANADFTALYEQALTDLKALLITSGDAEATLESLTELLKDQSTLDDSTIEQESNSLAQYLDQ